MRKTKVVSQLVETDATPHCPVGTVPIGISSVVTPSGDQVVNMDIEHVRKVGSGAAIGAKGNPRRCVVKEPGSQVNEAHMTQSIGFDAPKKTVG